MAETEQGVFTEWTDSLKWRKYMDTTNYFLLKRGQNSPMRGEDGPVPYDEDDDDD